MKTDSLKLNETNPRRISPEALEKLKDSLHELPELMKWRPLIINDDNVILAGNQRFKAIQALKMEEIPDEWVVNASELSEQKRRRLIIADNIQSGEWDFLALMDQYAAEELAAFGMSNEDMEFLYNLKAVEESDPKDIRAGILAEKFIVPPFSVLDSRRGYWREREQKWDSLIMDRGESRENLMKMDHLTASDKYGIESPSNDVSILSSVLAEVILRWFAPGPHQARVFDPFAGDTVFGYVAASLGHRFKGIELRREQCDLNQARVDADSLDAKYHCDDGRNVLKYTKPDSQDLLFSCPPYFDLEKYSDLPNDASNQASYGDFRNLIETAFVKSIRCLKNNRFAAIVVSEIRDKSGLYLPFLQDIKNIFLQAGMSFYNDIVLLNVPTTAHIRAARLMRLRKVVHVHQNLLVFYKGDPARIKENFPDLMTEIEETETPEE